MADRITPSDIVMIRPLNFYVNPQTALDNEFQVSVDDANGERIRNQAMIEFDEAVNTLRSNGVTVIVFDSVDDNTPDCVFPNNWFSSHPDGTLVIYPMYTENRRAERRDDILDLIRDRYSVTSFVDLASYELDGKILEGTGAIVIDHVNNTAYCALSKRADKSLFIEWSRQLGFKPIYFETKGLTGAPIYHTNVILAIGERFAVLCPDFIEDAAARAHILDRLQADGKDVITLSVDQITQFAGNGMELKGKDGNIFVVSTTALECLTTRQKERISRYAKLVSVDIPTIEYAGGSARCMMAGIHLTPTGS